MNPAVGPRPDFFISRTGADAAWAQWVAQELEQAGYTTFLQDWDFLPGQSFVENMQKGLECEHAIALLSPEYLAAAFTRPEWQAAFARDAKIDGRRLIPIRLRTCEIPTLIAHYVFIDFIGKSEDQARQALLEGVSGQRRKRLAAFPEFPSGSRHPTFSGTQAHLRGPAPVGPACSSGSGSGTYETRRCVVESGHPAGFPNRFWRRRQDFPGDQLVASPRRARRGPRPRVVLLLARIVRRTGFCGAFPGPRASTMV